MYNLGKSTVTNLISIRNQHLLIQVKRLDISWNRKVLTLEECKFALKKPLIIAFNGESAYFVQQVSALFNIFATLKPLNKEVLLVVKTQTLFLIYDYIY